MPLGRIALCSVKGIIKIMEYEKEVTGNGYIDLTDAVANKLLELKAYGGCEQDLTPTPTTPVDIVCNNGVLKASPNLLDIPNMQETRAGITASVNNGLVTLTGTTESGYNLQIVPSSQPVFLTAGTYTISYTGTFEISAGTILLQIRQIGGSTIDTLSNTKRYTTLTLAEDTEIYLNINVGATGRTLNVSMNIQLEKGSSATAYKPYGQIYTYGTVETIALNTFSQENYLNAYCPNGGTITEHTTSRIFIVPCKPNTEYGFIFDNSNISSPRCVISGFTDEPTIGMRVQQNLYSSSNTEAKLHDTTFTTNNNINYLVLWLMYNKNDTDTQEAVDKAILYETNNTATCEDLLGVGDYKDEQEILSGNVITKVGVMVLDGTENWTSSGGVYYAKVSDSIAGYGRKAPICTHYVGSDEMNANMPSNSVKTSNNNDGTELRVYVKDTAQTSVADFKQYLKDQLAAGTPVIVVYPLATPTTLSVAGQSLSIPAGNSRIEIVEGSILDLPLYAKYKSTSE